LADACSVHTLCERRINRDSLERAVFTQLAEIYHDRTTIQSAIEQAATQHDYDRANLSERRAASEGDPAEPSALGP
jgi:hypothetical protein